MTSRGESLPRELADALERARPRLGSLGSSVIYFHSTGSTNDAAASLVAASDGSGGAGAARSEGATRAERIARAEGTIVIADAQTAGRGRRGHSWFSPPGAGLYVSVVLAPGRARQAADRATALTTLAAGVALAEGIELATGLRADIKWPNDLLIGRRKLAGILAEGVTAGAASAVHAVVLGYGINVGMTQPPRELADRVTSLEAELGRPIDRWMIAVETLVALSRRYGDLLDARFDAILDAWRARAPRSRGAHVTWDDGRRRGLTAGIDDTGALLVREGERLERVVSGEVLWS
jgi:BirA family transcriptional regulator, biotin operon repressor / biotin---[acetyl-CoA-carboxylase] ligase